MNMYDDIIDSRDINDRIEDLEGAESLTLAERDELETLQALAAQGEGASEDWRHGATLVRDSYFREYAEELADDIGVIDHNAAWPLTHIDWDSAAHALQQDYTPVYFGGVTYWVR